MVAMEKLAQDFGDEVVLAAVHYNDVMTLKDYYSITRSFSDGFPSMAVSRTGKAVRGLTIVRQTDGTAKKILNR